MVCGVVPDSLVPGLVWPIARDQSVLLKVYDALRNADADRIKQAADTIDLAAPGSLGRPHRRAGQPRGADEASRLVDEWLDERLPHRGRAGAG
jgi:hypothetical protein